MFINFGDNANLDGMGFAPFGKVVSGMKVVDALYAGYGEGAPHGRGPDQGRLQTQGNAYLMQGFPAHGLRQEGDHRTLTVRCCDMGAG